MYDSIENLLAAISTLLRAVGKICTANDTSEPGVSVITPTLSYYSDARRYSLLAQRGRSVALSFTAHRCGWKSNFFDGKARNSFEISDIAGDNCGVHK